MTLSTTSLPNKPRKRSVSKDAKSPKGSSESMHQFGQDKAGQSHEDVLKQSKGGKGDTRHCVSDALRYAAGHTLGVFFAHFLLSLRRATSVGDTLAGSKVPSHKQVPCDSSSEKGPRHSFLSLQRSQVAAPPTRCSCHDTETTRGHGFHSLTCYKIPINIAESIIGATSGGDVAPTPRCDLEQQHAACLARLQRLIQDPAANVAVVRKEYDLLKQLANGVELHYCHDVETVLDRLLGLIKDCRSCHLGTPSWELVQHYVQELLEARVLHNNEFQARLAQQGAITQELIEDCARFDGADAFDAMLRDDKNRLSTFCEMWNEGVTAADAAAKDADLSSTLTAVAGVERRVATSQAMVARLVSDIEGKQSFDHDKWREVMIIEKKLASAFARRVPEWIELVAEQFRRPEPDGNMVMVLGLASKSLAARLLLLRGGDHPPLTNGPARLSKKVLRDLAAHFAAARSDFASREFATSIPGLIKVVKALPEFHFCWYLLAMAHRDTEKPSGYKKSIAAFKSVLTGPATNAEVHYNLGVSLQVCSCHFNPPRPSPLPSVRFLDLTVISCSVQNVGDWDEALLSYQSALGIDPQHAECEQRCLLAHSRISTYNFRQRQSPKDGAFLIPPDSDSWESPVMKAPQRKQARRKRKRNAEHSEPPPQGPTGARALSRKQPTAVNDEQDAAKRSRSCTQICSDCGKKFQSFQGYSYHVQKRVCTNKIVDLGTSCTNCGKVHSSASCLPTT